MTNESDDRRNRLAAAIIAGGAAYVANLSKDRWRAHAARTMATLL